VNYPRRQPKHRLQLFADARHELLNENNREAVTVCLFDWLANAFADSSTEAAVRETVD
jgi:alpha-beta hydrolase superfamily lysophospholipase